MAEIKRISGPVIVGKGMKGAKMYDLVRVGTLGLIGEVIELNDDEAILQVYEDTSGLKPGEKIENTGMPLSIELGPGLLGRILDGIGRPLPELADKSGDFITRGIEASTINKDAVYDFKAEKNNGDEVKQGDSLGHVQETELFKHKIIVPYGINGKLLEIYGGNHKVDDVIAKIETNEGVKEIRLSQRWPVRKSRPIIKKLDPSEMLVSGQRVFDTFFPIVKGGTAAIPGPFGSGKTVSQHQLAKWVDADVVVYIGCGERGNEMTEVLKDFPELIDPRTNKPLMERTVLIANTSNMPVAAREACIYTGITIAEYFRDMGYDVALMADSTSRWAEALREISSRLEEMPGEEGYPAYLASRLAQFYERAGKVKALNGEEGSISVIGAVSPPGGDFSEPVTQNTLKITKVFWALDAPLAYRRHFPAINWLTSYSLYYDKLHAFYKKTADEFPKIIDEAMRLLQKESELQEIVQLVGPDALPEEDKLVLESSRKIREDFLQQHAYHDVDSYCDMEKQYLMLRTIVYYHEKLLEMVKKGVRVEKLRNAELDEKIARMKYQKEYEKYIRDIKRRTDSIKSE
jgi:V/A-type H+-transporting ATPase subunit A